VSYDCLGKVTFDVVAPGTTVTAPKRKNRFFEKETQQDTIIEFIEPDQPLCNLPITVTEETITVNGLHSISSAVSHISASLLLLQRNGDTALETHLWRTDFNDIVEKITFATPKIAGRYVVRAYDQTHRRVVGESEMIKTERIVKLEKGSVAPGETIKVFLQNFDPSALKDDTIEHSLHLFDNDVDSLTRCKLERLHQQVVFDSETEIASVQFTVPREVLNGNYSIVLMQGPLLVCKSTKLVVCTPSISNEIAQEVAKQVALIKENTPTQNNTWEEKTGNASGAKIVSKSPPSIRLRKKGTSTGVRLTCPNTLDMLIKLARKHCDAEEDMVKIVDDQGDEIVDIRTIRNGDTLYVSK
jgi:hypothetical protein